MAVTFKLLLEETDHEATLLRSISVIFYRAVPTSLSYLRTHPSSQGAVFQVFFIRPQEKSLKEQLKF
jgi:hypothetical protein